MTCIDGHRFGQALQEGDLGALLTAFADEFTFHLIGHDRPVHALAEASFLLGTLLEAQADVRVKTVLSEDGREVVSFESRVGGHPAEGIALVHLRPDGRITQLTLFLRPLGAAQHVTDAAHPGGGAP
jgi:hypothetical protein